MQLMETLVELIEETADLFAIFFGVLGSLIIAIGAIAAIVHFIRKVLERPGKTVSRRQIDSIRVEFGRYINFGLEFFIAKDVLETMFAPTWAEVGQLFVLVIIRTLISYFLMFEIEKVEEDIHQR